MLKRLTYSNVTATLALVLAVGTGSSYAVSKIDGGAVKSRTLSGKKLKKDTLTGKEIREDRLATVPSASTAATAGDAAKLGGKAAGAYVQGNVALTMERTTLTAPSGEKVIDTPVGQFRLRCLGATADVRYYNTTGAASSLWRTGVRAASTSALLDSVAPGGDYGMAYATPAWSLLRAEQGDKVARLDVNSDKVDASTCRFAWELAVQS